MAVDFEKIKEIATDIEDIAVSLGLETKNQGKHTYILCPKHNDEHFGSCFLTDKGYHCYACGAGGDIFTLVMDTRGCTITEACQWLADLYGISSSKRKSEEILSKKDCDLLGIKDVRIYEPINMSYYKEDFKEYEGEAQYKITYDFFSREKAEKLGFDGVYILQKLSSRNPLLELKRKDYISYRNLIFEKALESYKLFKENLQVCHYDEREDIINDLEKCKALINKYKPKGLSLKKSNNVKKNKNRINRFDNLI